MNIRPAAAADVSAAVPLIFETMGSFADVLFGAGDHETALRVLAWLFVHRGNVFSHEFTDLAEMDGHIAGLLLSIPGRKLPATFLPSLRDLAGFYGVRGTVSFFYHSLPVLGDGDAAGDEYLVSNLAVEACYRRQGIGQRLMALADRLAVESGLRKCCLWVELGNDAAKDLYLKCGYKVVRRRRSIWLKRRLKTPEYEKMVKILSKDGK